MINILVDRDHHFLGALWIQGRGGAGLRWGNPEGRRSDWMRVFALAVFNQLGRVVRLIGREAPALKGSEAAFPQAAASSLPDALSEIVVP